MKDPILNLFYMSFWKVLFFDRTWMGPHFTTQESSQSGRFPFANPEGSLIFERLRKAPHFVNAKGSQSGRVRNCQSVRVLFFERTRCTIPPIREDPNPESSSFLIALRGGNASPNRKVTNPIGSPIREDPNPENSSFSNALRGGNASPNRKVPNPIRSFFTNTEGS